jgi:hypothetical protein
MLARRPLSKIFLVVIAWAVYFPNGTAQTNTVHHRDYLDALEKVQQAEPSIVHEMERLQFGSVAHYDFLQYQHIELIRHARALAHPPAGLTQSARAEIVAAAEQLLKSAGEMEWVIADFLRALAMLRNASSNTLDIAATLKLGASHSVAANLDILVQQTTRFAEAGYNGDWDNLRATFRAVLDSPIDEQGRRELLFQRKILQDNASAIDQLRRKLGESAVDQYAQKIADLYPS